MVRGMTAQELKIARKKLGMTQQEFADAISGTIRELRSWEQGVNKANKYAIIVINQLLERNGVKHE